MERSRKWENFCSIYNRNHWICLSFGAWSIGYFVHSILLQHGVNVCVYIKCKCSIGLTEFHIDGTFRKLLYWFLQSASILRILTILITGKALCNLLELLGESLLHPSLESIAASEDVSVKQACRILGWNLPTFKLHHTAKLQGLGFGIGFLFLQVIDTRVADFRVCLWILKFWSKWKPRKLKVWRTF